MTVPPLATSFLMSMEVLGTTLCHRFKLRSDGVDAVMDSSCGVGVDGVVADEADEFIQVGPLPGGEVVAYHRLRGLAHLENLPRPIDFRRRISMVDGRSLRAKLDRIIAIQDLLRLPRSDQW